MLAIEASQDDELASIRLPYEDYPEVVIYHHVRILSDGGLIHAVENHRVNSGVSWLPHALTWQGHDFLAAVGDPAVWQKLTDEGVVDKPFAMITEAARAALAHGH